MSDDIHPGQEDVIAANIALHRSEAEIYDLLHPEIWNHREQKRIARHIQFAREHIAKKNPLALDLGAGTGNVTMKLLAADFDVVSVDLSAQMLVVLKRKVERISGRHHSWIIAMEVEAFLKQDRRKFDIVTMSSFLHHLLDYKKVTQEIISKIYPGGFLYIVHEPTREIFNPLAKFLLWLAPRIHDHFLIPTYARKIFLKLRYEHADYHAGLDVSQLTNVIEKAGCDIVIFERYIATKMRSFSFLISLLSRSRNNVAVMARKRALL